MLSRMRAVWNRHAKFKEEACDGKLGKTAKFWLRYMEKVWLMLRFLRATKENNLELHIATLEQMSSIFFAFDANDARYTAVYLLMLMNLEESRPGAKQLLSSNGFSVNRSSVPGSRSAVEITIEQTINRHAKSQGGIIGFSRNHSAYHRWCKTRHTIASFLQATRKMV